MAGVETKYNPANKAATLGSVFQDQTTFYYYLTQFKEIQSALYQLDSITAYHLPQAENINLMLIDGFAEIEDVLNQLNTHDSSKNYNGTVYSVGGGYYYLQFI